MARLDRVVAGFTEMRLLMGLPTPCPECSDPERPMYCSACIRALAAVMGETVQYTRDTYGRKRGAYSERARKGMRYTIVSDAEDNARNG